MSSNYLKNSAHIHFHLRGGLTLPVYQWDTINAVKDTLISRICSSRTLKDDNKSHRESNLFCYLLIFTDALFIGSKILLVFAWSSNGSESDQI